MSSSPRTNGRFEVGERVQVRWKSGMMGDGYIHRVFSSGAYTVILDEPTSRGRRTHCEPHEVFEPAQNDLFGAG